jgi:hypothetical protein
MAAAVTDRDRGDDPTTPTLMMSQPVSVTTSAMVLRSEPTE